MASQVVRQTSFWLILLALFGGLAALPQTLDIGGDGADKLGGSYMDPIRGIQILKQTCSSKDITTVENATVDASYLAGAGLAAAQNFTDLPFKFFFPGDSGSAIEVARVYHRIQRLQQEKGPLIFVGCRDDYHRCNASKNPFRSPGYSAQFPTQHRSPHIIMCPLGLALNRNPTPCTRTPGGIFLGSMMLRLLIYLHAVSGFGIPPELGNSETAAKIGAMVSKGQNTTHDANALAFLGSWSWDLGLGGPPWNQQQTCLGEFAKGTFDASIEPFKVFFG
ncbi:MAG: hypothetical protein Q9218_001857 [Villophora microphyllina]